MPNYPTATDIFRSVLVLNIMLFDSHAHINFESFENIWKEVLDDCQKNDIWVVNIGSQFPTSKRAVEIAEEYEKGVYASIGVHPIHSHEQENAFDYKKFVDLITVGAGLVPAQDSGDHKGRPYNTNKIVAIGETGLDFFHSAKYFEIQKKTFIEQINLAKEFDLSLIIHGRNSKDGAINCYQEIYKIIKKEKVKNAVVHCFGGNADEAKQFMGLGLYIGVTGIVTFKNAKELQSMVRDVIPLEKILIETDSPYLAPDPHRGEQNKPQYVEYVARKIAELKNISYEKACEVLCANARKFYNV
ncbi:MAG: Mg-dependent DNase [Parcubacteria group bacterium GW2011_GWA2_38_13]|nr:MAG: Mg-dependent DNase [Parcubacteria group bacterium GW2011_GWA2_38_13]